MFYKLYQLSLRISQVRLLLSTVRSIWFVKIKKRPLQVFSGDTGSLSEHAIFSNKRRIVQNKENPHPNAKYLLGIDLGQNGSKSSFLINPLLSITKIQSNLKTVKVLSIGPRTEGEIFNILAYGFRKENIKAVDLMSYTPWIEVGDMHNLPFPDNSFDIIICGWVIAYSDNKKKAAAEMARVTKPGGVISIGVSYSPKTNEDIIEERGYLIGSPERLLTTEDVVNCFEPKNVGTVYFRHDVEESVMDKRNKIITVLSVKK